MKKYFFSVALMTALFVHQTTMAQANYWALFPGNLMNCNNQTFSTIADQSNSIGVPLSFNEEVNSAFDRYGNLIFTVSREGIYYADGTPVREFLAPHGCDDRAVSEIEIIPIYSSCNSYYVMCYSRHQTRVSACSDNKYHLLLYRVDYDQMSGILSVTDNELDNFSNTFVGGETGIVADVLDPGTLQRNVYTRDFGKLRRWTFDQYGNYSSATITSSLPIGNEALTELSSTGIMAYPIATSSGTAVYFYDVINGSYVNTLNVTGADIAGIEYVPSTGEWYVSYRNFTNRTQGGILYATVSSSSLTSTTITGSTDFRMGELELAKNGRLYTVGASSTATHAATAAGKLAYIDIASAPHAVPTYVSPSVSVRNLHTQSMYQLQNQIDNDDYNNYFIPKSNGDFTIGGQPRVEPYPVNCNPQHVCANPALYQMFLNMSSPIVASFQNYMISWYETNECGEANGNESLNYNDVWHSGPLGSVDIGNYYGVTSLSDPQAQGRYFVVTVDVDDPCDQVVIHEEAFIYIEYWQPSEVAYWEVNNDPTNTSFTPPSGVCAVAPASCGNNPMVRIRHGYPDVQDYQITIKDLGTACTSSPIAVFTGSAVSIGSFTGPIDVPLEAYLQNYCGYTGPDYFDAAAGHTYEVEVSVTTTCGVVSDGPKYFVGNVACRGAHTTAVSTTPTIGDLFTLMPNPANDHANLLLHLKESRKVQVQVLDGLGRVVYEQPATTIAKGSQNVIIPTSNLAPGVYTVRVATPEGSSSKRLSVIR